MTSEEIASLNLPHRFTHHPPHGDQVERYQALREAALEFANLIARLCPSSNLTQYAIDYVDGAVMWANASIARNEPAPKPE